MTIAVVVEGDTDLPVVRKLTKDAGLTIAAEIDCGGKHQLDADLSGYNNAAKGSPWFVLRDLNSDAQCAGQFLAARNSTAARWMCFRIAVREMESWVLADAAAISDFLRIPRSAVPTDPDAEDDPTRTIVDLARRSRSRTIEKALVPRAGTSTAVGPLYEAKMIEFTRERWDLDRACQRSRSLARARERLREMAREWARYVVGGR